MMLYASSVQISNKPFKDDLKRQPHSVSEESSRVFAVLFFLFTIEAD
jgi:hypothetical protein